MREVSEQKAARYAKGLAAKARTDVAASDITPKEVAAVDNYAADVKERREIPEEYADVTLTWP